jgi:hypothetical protein
MCISSAWLCHLYSFRVNFESTLSFIKESVNILRANILLTYLRDYACRGEIECVDMNWTELCEQ